MRNLALLGSLALSIACGPVVSAETASQPPDTSFSIHATHLLGFEQTRNNRNGTMTIQGDSLLFHENGKPDAQLKIASVRSVFLGSESKQVGGVPMMLGKAAVPYSGGRVVSLFAHKKYDTLTMEYVDDNGGLHGAIFQLNKGQADLVRDQLVAHGAQVTSADAGSTKQASPEVAHEIK